MKGKKKRMFQLTLNQIDKWELLLGYLKSVGSLSYLVAAKEIAPLTGREHIHCFVQFSFPVNLSIKKVQGAHVEICKGTPQQNREYVKKDGNVIEEIGSIKNWGNYSIREVKNMTENERLDLSFSYYEKVKSLKCDESNVMDAENYYKKVEVYYFYGESGAGKTQMAIEKIIELAKDNKIKDTKFNEVKYCNGFWIGVDSSSICDVALYDDFRDSHMYPSEFINFIDYNTHNMNIKNGHIKNTFKVIMITSIQPPEDLYKKAMEINEEPKYQWLRRITYSIHVENSK